MGIYPDKAIIQKDTGTPMFTAALFTVANTWTQLKCLSTDEWIKTFGTYIQWNTTQSLKKNKIMLFRATWMQLEIIILSEISPKDKNKYHMLSLICGI